MKSQTRYFPSLALAFLVHFSTPTVRAEQHHATFTSEIWEVKIPVGDAVQYFPINNELSSDPFKKPIADDESTRQY